MRPGLHIFAVVFCVLQSLRLTFGFIRPFNQRACRQTCATNLTFSADGGSGLFCDKGCSVEQCYRGCTLYPAAVHSSCQRACASTVGEEMNSTRHQNINSDEIKNCIQGCIFSLDEYYNSIKDELGVLHRPTLIVSTLNYSSLTLQWDTHILENVTYKVHGRLVDMDSGWHLHPHTRFLGDGRVNLTRLEPYVTYKFKVLALVSSLPEHILESPESVHITTLPHGAPSTAPQITSLTSPSPRVISLSWTPPVFPHGKVISYRIYVNPVNHRLVNQTTIEVPGNVTSWLLSQLQSAQRYVISLSAWNAFAEGPKTSRNITTPSPETLSSHEIAYLILGTANKIVKRRFQDVVHYEPQFSTPVYEHPDQSIFILGISLHIRKQLILATDTSGRVTLISLKDNSTKNNHYPSILEPGAISVDWLADRVYVASRDRIYSCLLHEDRCVVVIYGLARSASDIKVDPINGYLYFIINGDGKGLYRIALGMLTNVLTTSYYSPVRPQLLPQLIVAMDDLKTHVIDFYNFRLYVVNDTAKVMMAALLDGSSLRPFHDKIVNSAFSQVTGIVFYNQTFIWTDRRKMYVEEYERPIKNYRHNELLFFTPPYAGMNVLHSSTQPMPVPYSAPEQVEALFTRSRVVITWIPPPLLQYQGAGAWQNWTYELRMTTSGQKGSSLKEFSIPGLNMTINNLEPDSVYTINIRAKSEAGSGPWSRDFVGRTLKQDGLSVLMGIAGGQIVEKNLSDGSEVSVVNFYSDATDIDWHDEIIIWVTTSGSLSVFNRTSRQKRHLWSASKAYCVAYDWLGHKIYWSEPGQGMIRRSDVNGITNEYIRQTSARDLAIDAVNGRLYWATQHSIETCRLNGDEHQEIFTLPYFSGEHVISLTINFDLGKVLWYVKNYNSQSVYMADLITSHASQTTPSWRKVGEFKSISSTSKMQYFSQRLFWLTEQNSLVVGDSQCNYTSNISFHANLTSFAVVHPSIHSYPENLALDKVRVIPNPIKSESISTQGDWSNFNLTWSRSSEVTHGVVFYKVFVDIGKENRHFITSKQWKEISGLSPYTQLVVSIQPYTYWGYADSTTVSVRSPMSIPTAPLSPEVYVVQHQNSSSQSQTLAADFRWMTPQLTNGIISHYLVTYWLGDPSESGSTVKVKGTERHFKLTPLLKSQTYHFKVAACTEAGCGPESVTRAAVTNALNPIPMLLVASKHSLSIMEVDGVLNATIVVADATPKSASFLSQENPRIFWLDVHNKVYGISGAVSEEVADLHGSVRDISIDWISRTIYAVVSVSPGESRIVQYDLDIKDERRVLTRPGLNGSIAIDPYNRIILWAESSSTGQNQIISADISTGETTVILGNTKRGNVKKACSCSQTMNVASVIALDFKGFDGSTEIVFADQVNGAVYSSDITGCHCHKIIQPTPSKRMGLPPSLLAVDHLRVTWYNKTEGKLYSVAKATGEGLVIHDVGDIEDIQAYGSHLQPLPDSQCLYPGTYNSSIEKVHVESTLIRLHLFTPDRPPACQKISSPRNKYTVYYKKVKVSKSGGAAPEPESCQTDLSACQKQKSFKPVLELTDLEPFTQYQIQVAVSNYYTEYLSEALGEPQFVTTLFGVPYAAANVIASPLNPEMVLVSWQPPLKYNGPVENISYVVQFSTLTVEGHIQRETENIIFQASDGLLEAVLKDLEPGHDYNIKVQTCTANRSLCNISDVVQTRTFMTPSDIIVVNSTAHSVWLQWRSPSDNAILRHQILYAVVKPGALEWNMERIVPTATENFTEYTVEVPGLKPATLYAFRIRANYRARPFDKSFYLWPPEQTRFKHKTAIFYPDQPLPPMVTHLRSGAYEVRWGKPDDNGAPIIHYMLDYRNIHHGAWRTAYNGSLERWVVEPSLLEEGKPYIFRVSAVNSQGTSFYSDNSTVFMAPYAAEDSLSSDVTVGIIVGIAVLLFIVVVVVVVVCNQHGKNKRKPFVIRGPDTELATLRELPRTAFQRSNTLYALDIQCTDEEIAKLPHFSRSQLMLTTFLGSGAFGEVFEGLAKNILGDGSGETKCAVKTLRKSASEQEKEEFLKEALLMKNFQHEHILSLLGVCLDNDPRFIIMELMEGGDLLSFLRSCRATATKPASLLLPDLVKISVHVAKGCKYLEEMHFVHRDLAARNCLVSSKSTADMTVKIGDFGLARDIYKNDYYRKEGEGLLPVRWMSPESLVDGFFTTQSDIWAFGVLMWEVVTLGQQPYPARTNIEVLHFVRDHGKLERPDKCSDEMYCLMNKCWNYQPDHRPSFASLLQDLQSFYDKCCLMSPGQIASFSPSIFGDAGSSHRTHSVKQKLSDSVIVSSTQDKLVVDLTKIGRKRVHSNEDAQQMMLYASSSAGHKDQFPAAGEYDHNGYLEPRGNRNGRYLDLVNYAPELRYLKDSYGNPLVSNSGPPVASVHMTRKGYHPSHINYTLLSPNDDVAAIEECYREADGFKANNVGADEYSRNLAQSPSRDKSKYPYNLVSLEEHSIYSPVQTGQENYSTGASSRDLDNYYHHSHTSRPSPGPKMVASSGQQRKYSDQDLYSSTTPFRQQQSSSSSQDHRYATVECNNNSNNMSNGNYMPGFPHHCNSVSSNGSARNRHGSSGSSKNYSSKLSHLNISLPSAAEDAGSKLSISQDTWANNSDDVFLDDSTSFCLSSQHGTEYSAYPRQVYSSIRSQIQVYPEEVDTMVDNECTQVSLV